MTFDEDAVARNESFRQEAKLCPNCGVRDANPGNTFCDECTRKNVAGEPTEYQVETLQPEAMSVGQLNRVVRALREKLYQARLKAQDADRVREELEVSTRLVNRLAAATSPPSQLEPVERIVAAAIRQDGCVFTGPHHATIIHYVARCAGIKPVTGEQGFMTSTGRFVNRSIARRIAFLAGQVKVMVDPLYSEELWVVPDHEAAAREGRKEALAAVVLAVEALERDPVTRQQVVAYGVRAGTMFVHSVVNLVRSMLKKAEAES